MTSLLILVALLLTACGVEGVSEPPPREPPPPRHEPPPPVEEPPPADDPPPVEDPPPADPSDAAEAVRLANSARATGTACGATFHPPAAPLQLEARLTQAAQAHSDDMAATDRMSHTGSDGSSPGDRVARTGYTFSAWGENVAWGYRSVEAVMNGWLGSPGHCSNIMDPRFSELGVARSGNYWTMVLARPRAGADWPRCA